MEVIRCVLVGPPASGKSTVKHFLVHNEPKAVISSEQYAVQEGTSAWQPVSSDIMKNSLHDCIASEAYEKKNQYPVGVEAKEAEHVQREALIMKQAASDPFALLNQQGQHECSAEKRDGCSPTKQAQSDLASLDQQYSQVLEEMGGEGVRIKLKNASFIHLLDTGGQPSFQDVLPLLLDVPCTYIQVFDASRRLSERIPITYRPIEGKKVYLRDAECGRDMMLRSFSSMQTMAQKCSKEMGLFQQKNSSSPPQLRIFVVGTHKDELIAQGRLDEATKEITTFFETMKGKPYYTSIQWDEKNRQQCFLINALAVSERAYINDLRGCISSEGSLKLDVPVMWFICQEVTRCTPKKFFRIQDLEAFCRKHHFVDGENAASQFRALLQLLNLLGFYAFFDLEDVPDKDNFVCTDRGVFFKEVSTLLAVQFSAPNGAEVESFKETGILIFTQKCFKQLGVCQEMDAQWFLKALLHLGIAARVHSSNDVQEYFIPAALPQSWPMRDPDPVASVAPLCLTYTIKGGTTSLYTFMPQGVLCRLAIELIHKGWEICRREKNTRTLLLFRWKEFEIFLKESSGYISIIPQLVEDLETPRASTSLHAKCVDLRHIISDCLSISTKAVLGNNFENVTPLQLAAGFECPCKKVDIPHLAVPSETGKSLDCLETCKSQKYSIEQHIWFSALPEVHGVAVSTFAFMQLTCS